MQFVLTDIEAQIHLQKILIQGRNAIFNSMLLVYPERGDFTCDVISGLPIIVTSHRGSSAFSLSPYQGAESGIKPVITYSFDNEIFKPYYYSSRLDEAQMDIRFAPAHQSAVYEIGFDRTKPTYLIINSRNGEMVVNGDGVSGFQDLRSRTKVYIYLETEQKPEKVMNEKTYIKLYFGEGR